MTQQPPGGILEYRKSPEGIREIAKRQRAIIMCILVQLALYVVLIAGQRTFPPLVVLGVAGAMLAVDVVGVIFVFLLATKLYGIGVGILLGLLTFAPCLGLITLLIVNARATAILRQAGLKVGLLGATVPPNM